MTHLFLNIGYGLGIIALVIKDVLWLRAILAISQFSLATTALLMHNHNAAFWNMTFVVINLYHVVRIIRERRPIELPAELNDLYERIFPSMSKKEFFYFWQIGNTCRVIDELLIREGERQENVSLILSGKVDIIKAHGKIAELSRGSFVAEMSFLTGDPASADVRAAGAVELISWPQEKLRGLKQLNSGLYMKIQHILGKDLAGKVKASSGG